MHQKEKHSEFEHVRTAHTTQVTHLIFHSTTLYLLL